jgi:putative iron-dependent peroxidase
MKAWDALPIEAQERIIGRRKLSDVELSKAEKPTSAHNALNVIEENGIQLQILRDNMPFGRPGYGEFGTYFIGYSRTPRITETMLQNMFVGRPPGNYDRLLDFSTAVTGSLFFVPSATFLDNIGGDEPDSKADVVVETSDAPPDSLARDTSLRIGSLKGEKNE